MNFINSDIMLTITVYDDEYETCIEKHMTVEEILDAYTNEGCPTKIEQPERKTGKWINHRNDNGHNIADCSECGEALQWFDDDIKPNFCPNCGADMRGDKT